MPPLSLLVVDAGGEHQCERMLYLERREDNAETTVCCSSFITVAQHMPGHRGV